MFGRDPIHKIIRQMSGASAGDYEAAIIAELKKFRQQGQPADDITLVVIKNSRVNNFRSNLLNMINFLSDPS